jgi:hypothetical protein
MNWRLGLFLAVVAAVIAWRTDGGLGVWLAAYLGLALVAVGVLALQHTSRHSGRK